MKLALLVIALALVWVAITNGFNLPNLLFGIAIAMAAVFVLRADFARPRIINKLGKVVALAGLFLRELLVSAVKVAIVVLTPDLKTTLRPAIVAFPLTVRTDAEITLLACLITLTPGTLSVDVSPDRSQLFVHVLTLQDRSALIAEIAGGFEHRISEIYA